MVQGLPAYMLAREPRAYGNCPGGACCSSSPATSAGSYKSWRVTPAGVRDASSSGDLPVSALTCCSKRARGSLVMALSAALTLAQDAGQGAACQQRDLVGPAREVERLFEAGEQPDQAWPVRNGDDSHVHLAHGIGRQRVTQLSVIGRVGNGTEVEAGFDGRL